MKSIRDVDLAIAQLAERIEAQRRLALIFIPIAGGLLGGGIATLLLLLVGKL